MEFFSPYFRDGEKIFLDHLRCTLTVGNVSDVNMNGLFLSWQKCFSLSGEVRIARMKCRVEMVGFAHLFNQVAV